MNFRMQKMNFVFNGLPTRWPIGKQQRFLGECVPGGVCTRCVAKLLMLGGRPVDVEVEK